MGEAPQLYVSGRTREPFRARQLDRGHPQPLDVPRMSNRPHCDAIVNFENLLPGPPYRDKKDTISVTQGGNRAARRELRFNVFAAIRDRLDPPIRFFDHARVS